MPADTKKEVTQTKKTTKKVTNPEIAPGIRRYGKVQWRRMTGRHAKWVRLAKNGKPVKKTIQKKAPKTVTFNEKKKETRAIQAKGPRTYPAQVAPRRLPTARALRPAKIRSSIQPGVVAILLAGRYKGQRCIVLKALPSGLLLVTGPYKINGIPVRRVNPAYVIATSTKVDLAGVTVPDHVNDKYFKPTKSTAAKPAADKSVVVSAEKKVKLVVYTEI